jgi:ribosome maturation factor RimP
MTVPMEDLTALVEPVVKAAGLSLVRVLLQGGRDLTLQVMAENPETGQITLDQCASLSRALSAVLEASDPIPSAYRLEVSSPGIDRPLTRLPDFDRYVPHVARIELSEGLAIGGAIRKRFQGPLRGIDGDRVRLDADGLGEIALPFADIRTAKLLLTDALIRATTPLDPAGADVVRAEPLNTRPKTRQKVEE